MPGYIHSRVRACAYTCRPIGDLHDLAVRAGALCFLLFASRKCERRRRISIRAVCVLEKARDDVSLGCLCGTKRIIYIGMIGYYILQMRSVIEIIDGYTPEEENFCAGGLKLIDASCAIINIRKSPRVCGL